MDKPQDRLSPATEATKVAQTSLQYTFELIDRQKDLLARLDDKLSPVLHRVPTDELSAEKPSDAHHIVTVNDRLEDNNRWLGFIIDQLAV